MCDITLGRGRVLCKLMAGYAAFDFIKTDELGTNVTYDGSTGKVTDFGSGTTAYRYQVLTGSTLDDDSLVTPNNGSKYNTIVGTITLTGHEDTDPIEFDNLQAGMYSVVGILRSGKAKLFSPDTPIDITSLKILHGTEEGDLIGATMDLLGKADALSKYITGAVKGDPYAGILTPANMTVVE